MNYMEYWKKLNRQYNRGFADGMEGLYRPGFIYGRFRKQYDAGHLQGVRLLRQKK